MQQSETEKLIESLEKPFCKTDSVLGSFANFWAQFILVMRYYYNRMPDIIKFLSGIPLFLFGWKVYIFFAIFTCWTIILDKRFRYNLSEENFSLKNYIKVLLLRVLLFFIIGLMMNEYYKAPFGWLGMIYSIPMSLLSLGFTMPIFELRLNEIGNK